MVYHISRVDPKQKKLTNLKARAERARLKGEGDWMLERRQKGLKEECAVRKVTIISDSAYLVLVLESLSPNVMMLCYAI